MKIEMISQKYLKECLDYNYLTGVFHWRKRPLSHFTNERNMNIFNAKLAHKKAGSSHNRGYLTICIAMNGSKNHFLAHRVAWLYMNGAAPINHIDHINGNRTDNRILNLREADREINGKNVKLMSSNTSGLMGVTWHKKDKKWHVRANKNKTRMHLGSFDDFFEACCIRKSKENSFNYHANHGRTN